MSTVQSRVPGLQHSWQRKVTDLVHQPATTHLLLNATNRLKALRSIPGLEAGFPDAIQYLYCRSLHAQHVHLLR